MIHGQEVFGVEVDGQTRCRHWHSPRDIVAIKLECCGQWFSCFDCHREIAIHESGVWPRSEFDERAVLCGACGTALSITQYLDSGSKCPTCSAEFNPGCAKHFHFYFEPIEL